MADSEFGDFLAAVCVAHGSDELPHLDLLAALFSGVHAGLKTGLDCFHNFVQGEALLQVLFGGPADFAVHHAVLGQVFHEFLGYPEQAFLGLHDSDGVVKGFEVADQRTGVRRFAEPFAQRYGIGGGQCVADGLGQLDNGGRAESSVQVIVEGNLGQALQIEVEGRGSVKNGLSHVSKTSPRIHDHGQPDQQLG